MQRWECEEVDEDGVQVPASVAQIDLFYQLQMADQAKSGLANLVLHMHSVSRLATVSQTLKLTIGAVTFGADMDLLCLLVGF